MSKYLLGVGNSKLGETIHTWSLPAVKTCPGKSPACTAACYALKGRFATGPSRKRLAWNFAQSKLPDFASRMADEVFRRGALLVRVHVAGDFCSPSYLDKWYDAARSCPRTRFYAYTRSWRVSKLVDGLVSLSRLANFRLWYSADESTGAPASVPPGVRVAWLASPTPEGPKAGAAHDLTFLQTPSRKLPLDMVPANACAQEAPGGKAAGVTCANCGVCWS